MAWNDNLSGVPLTIASTPASPLREIEQEQRRLFYVALARTREVLVLSSFSRVDRARAHKLGMKVVGRRSRVRHRLSRARS